MIVKKIKKIRVWKWQKLNRLYEKYIIGAFFVHLHSFSITNIFNTVTHKEIINANKGFYQGFGVVSIEIFKECQQHHSLNGGPFKAQVQANQAESARVQQFLFYFSGHDYCRTTVFPISESLIIRCSVVPVLVHRDLATLHNISLFFRTSMNSHFT